MKELQHINVHIASYCILLLSEVHGGRRHPVHGSMTDERCVTARVTKAPKCIQSAKQSYLYIYIYVYTYTYSRPKSVPRILNRLI